METYVQQQRYTIGNVFAYKFVRWVDRTSAGHLAKTALSYIALATVIILIIAPAFTLGVLSSAVMSPKFCAVCGVIFLFFYGRSLIRFGRKSHTARKAKNQHSFHGVPVLELCDYLIETQGFKFEARDKLHLSQKQWRKMAEELDRHGVLYKSAEMNNARVLRPITRDQLIKQLQDGFPLVWSKQKSDWILREGPWQSWLWKEEQAEQKRRDETIKLERKKKRLKKEIENIQLSPSFNRRTLALV